VVKKTNIKKEAPRKEATPDAARNNFDLRKSAKFTSRESSVLQTEVAHKRESDIITNDIVDGLDSLASLTSQHLVEKNNMNSTDRPLSVEDAEAVEKLHTLRYLSGVLSNKSAQTPANEDNSEAAVAVKAVAVIPDAAKLPIISDLPYIDEEENELDEAIRCAIGLDNDEVVTSIQLASTESYSSASTLLVSQRSCSGTDTIHMSEKVIKRDYRDM
jgi:hypothetical protein